jgi:hypothetical protein
MTNTKAFNVGTILDNGDTVFHITDTEYWVVAPQSLWKECDWHEGVTYCQSIGYEMPDRDALQILYDCRDNVHNLPTAFVWSSTEYGSDNAWYLYFGYRNWSYDFKSLSCWTIPFRRVRKDTVDAELTNVPDTPYTEVVKGIYSVVNLKAAIGVLDRIHCSLDNHTVDKGYPAERTPVIVGGEEVPLEDLHYPVLLMGVRDRKSAKVVLYATPNTLLEMRWEDQPDFKKRSLSNAGGEVNGMTKTRMCDVTLITLEWSGDTNDYIVKNEGPLNGYHIPVEVLDKKIKDTNEVGLFGEFGQHQLFMDKDNSKRLEGKRLFTHSFGDFDVPVTLNPLTRIMEISPSNVAVTWTSAKLKCVSTGPIGQYALLASGILHLTTPAPIKPVMRALVHENSGKRVINKIITWDISSN